MSYVVIFQNCQTPAVSKQSPVNFANNNTYCCHVIEPLMMVTSTTYINPWK